jgi:DNA-binding NarL/FixJ family response regulator
VRCGGRSYDPPVADTPSTARRGLSPRQGQILERLLAGSRDREIAKELGISVSTVKAHVRAPLPILGLRSRRELHEQYDDPKHSVSAARTSSKD